MNLSDFYYDLPKERIAQSGTEKRDASKLFVFSETGAHQHKQFFAIAQDLNAGDVIVLNNTKVLPARLLGRKKTGGKIDALIIPEIVGQSRGIKTAQAFLRGRNLNPGTQIYFSCPNGDIRATILEYIVGARFRLQFDPPLNLEEVGVLPLPPYIKAKQEDSQRYQTTFAEKSGSLAAPTAGLHFSQEILEALKAKKVEVLFVTLHVGIGTFAPLREENFTTGSLHEEYFEVPKTTQAMLRKAIAEKRRIFAVGTTSVRTLESAFDPSAQSFQESGWTKLFIMPGYKFKFPFSGLLTNFHLPESSLLMLTAAWVGREKILAAYAEAIQREYRFYSLGDAMWIPSAPCSVHV